MATRRAAIGQRRLLEVPFIVEGALRIVVVMRPQDMAPVGFRQVRDEAVSFHLDNEASALVALVYSAVVVVPERVDEMV